MHSGLTVYKLFRNWQKAEFIFLLAGKISVRCEKLQGELLFPEEKQFLECRKWSNKLETFRKIRKMGTYLKTFNFFMQPFN